MEKTAEILGCSVKYLLGAEEVTKELKQNGSGCNDPTAYKAMKAFDSKNNRMEYLRGDIFYVNEIKGIMDSEPCAGRPAIIVSNDIGNKYSPNVEVVYLTTQSKKPMPTHVGIVCRTFSTAMCEAVDTVSKNRLGDYVRSLKEHEMKAIDDAIAISLGLKNDEQPTVVVSKDDKEMNKKLEDTTVALERTREMLKNIIQQKEAFRLELDDEKTKNSKLELSLRSLIKKQETAADTSVEVAVLTRERDLYKQQAEMYFEKLLSRV